MINVNEIPHTVDGLIEFWSKEGVISQTNEQSVQTDVLAYLGWVKALIIKRNELETDLSGMEEEYESCMESHQRLEREVERLNGILSEVSKDYE